jgi:hypothetical protein
MYRVVRQLAGYQHSRDHQHGQEIKDDCANEWLDGGLHPEFLA